MDGGMGKMEAALAREETAEVANARNAGFLDGCFVYTVDTKRDTKF